MIAYNFSYCYIARLNVHYCAFENQRLYIIIYKLLFSSASVTGIQKIILQPSIFDTNCTCTTFILSNGHSMSNLHLLWLPLNLIYALFLLFYCCCSFACLFGKQGKIYSVWLQFARIEIHYLYSQQSSYLFNQV